MPNKSVSWSALSATYISVLMLSANGLFSQSISFNALDITFHRSWIAFIILTALVWYNERNILLKQTKDYGSALLLGILLCVHWITFFHSMQLAGVATGMVALYTYPILTALIEPWFTKTKIDTIDILSTALVFIGIYLLIPGFDINHTSFQGVLWGLFSALTFALRNLIQRYRFSHYSAIKSLNYQVLISALLLTAFFSRSFPLEFLPLTLNDTWLLIILGILFTATPHALFAFALNNIRAKSVSLIACSQPAFGALLAFWVLEEKPETMVVVGGSIIVLAAIWETIHISGSANKS